jgi:hypothetical protein
VVVDAKRGSGKKSGRPLQRHVEWEQEVVGLVKRLLADPTDQLDLTQELIETIEDMILTAYLRGKQAAERSRKSN